MIDVEFLLGSDNELLECPVLNTNSPGAVLVFLLGFLLELCVLIDNPIDGFLF